MMIIPIYQKIVSRLNIHVLLQKIVAARISARRLPMQSKYELTPPLTRKCHVTRDIYHKSKNALGGIDNFQLLPPSIYAKYMRLNFNLL